MFLSAIILSGIEKHIMPTLIEMSGLEIKSFADNSIDRAVRESLEELNIRTSDFFDKENATNYITADTVLVNKLCAVIDRKLDTIFTNRGREEIAIPLGAASGVDILANTGPDIKFRMVYKDDTSVDYETSFSAAGINQTNYKVWLTVEVKMRLVNPLKSADVTATRKIMLIDTIIKGTVPQTYFQIENPESIISR
ncbi:sporulation protein YunB [Lachnospiraceae bacterium NSJ-143]|nr:sporulation protein YunB [Lachnospiraceae bacterium NSJ-143]